jgi:uncharacterized protein
MPMGDVFNERAMQRLFTNMNQHVPSSRRSLKALLREKEPVYTGKDGTIYRLKKDELQLLSSLIEEEDWPRLKLPLLIFTDTLYGDGYWKIMGKVEVKVISKLIGREPEKEDEMRLFYPYFKDVRDKLPTTTNAVFSY